MSIFHFEAHFSDGSVLTQTPEDISTLDPTKNCFYDVMQRIDDVVTFGLFSDETPETYAVDLRDGHFEINCTTSQTSNLPPGGFSFSAQDPRLDLGQAPEYRLIWFKRHRHHLVTGDGPQHDIEYHIGWQTTVDGKNHQQTIAVR